MEIAKEFTTKVAMLEPTTFFSAQLQLHTSIVHEAASIITTKMVSSVNHFILALISELKIIWYIQVFCHISCKVNIEF